MSSNFYPEPPERPYPAPSRHRRRIRRRVQTPAAAIAAPEAEGEAPGMPDGQRRRKSLTIDLPTSLYQRFKLACIEADRTMAEEILALVERRTAELEGSDGRN
jgi:hypothetical protein